MRAPGNASRIARTNGWSAAAVSARYRRRCPARRSSPRRARRTGRWSSACRSPRSAAPARREARSRGASGSGRNSITGGAKRTRCTECSRCACSIASFCSRHQRDDIAERRRAAAPAGRPPVPAPPSPARRWRPLAPAAATAGAAQAGRGGCARRRRDGQAADQVARASACRRHGTAGSAPSPPRRGGRGRFRPRRRPSAASATRAPSTGTDSRSASSAPRVRSASGRSWLSRRPGTDFSRVTRVQQFQQVLQQRAEIGATLIGAVGDRQRGGGLAGHHRLQQVEHRLAVRQAQHVGDLARR